MNSGCLRLSLSLIVLFFHAVSYGGPSGPAPGETALLEKLTSPREADRFKALEAAKTSNQSFSREAVEGLLMPLREKNVSALIFFFMETRCDLLCTIEARARMILENAPGAFPNIPYYYARVCQSGGFEALLRLFESHAGERMAICKAIGELHSSEGADFLLREAGAAKTGNRIPMLAGLKVLGRPVGKDHILSFLDTDLEREELILISQVKTDFTTSELLSFFRSNGRRQTYAIEYVFSDPETHFDALKSIIDEMMGRKLFDRVRELLMSDRIRSSTDERILRFREDVLKVVNGKR